MKNLSLGVEHDSMKGESDALHDTQYLIHQNTCRAPLPKTKELLPLTQKQLLFLHVQLAFAVSIRCSSTCDSGISITAEVFRTIEIGTTLAACSKDSCER